MQWFNGEEVTAPVIPTPVKPVVAPTPIIPVQSTGFQAINVPAAGILGQTRPRDPSPPPNALFNKHKRPRISESDRPPCLRCKILKKKVGTILFSWTRLIKIVWLFRSLRSLSSPKLWEWSRLLESFGMLSREDSWTCNLLLSRYLFFQDMIMPY